MAETFGKVAYTKQRGWHVDFRTIHFPNETKPRRVRVKSVPDYGMIETEQEAEKVLARIQSRIDGRKPYQVLRHYVRGDAADTAFLAAWERFCADREADTKLDRRRVIELRRYPERGYFDYFTSKDIRVHNITKSILAKWIHEMRKRVQVRGKNKGKPLSDKTLKNVLGDVMALLRWLKVEGDVDEIPDAPWDKIKVVDPNRIAPNQATVEKVLAAIPIIRAGVLLCRAEMGWRPAEARRLDVGDLVIGEMDDLSDAYIALPGSKCKTGNGRMLQLTARVREWFLHPEVVAHFGDVRRRFPAEPLFKNPHATKTDAGRWCEDSERNTVRRACEKAGVPMIPPNDLTRVYFATSQINAGTDIYTVKDWMGHTQVSTTEHYIGLTPKAIGSVTRLKGE